MRLNPKKTSSKSKGLSCPQIDQNGTWILELVHNFIFMFLLTGFVVHRRTAAERRIVKNHHFKCFHKSL